MSISYGELKTLVQNTNKTSVLKAFEKIQKTIQNEYITQNKEKSKYLKQLIKKVKNNKSINEDLSIILGNDEMTKEEILDVLSSLLEETKTEFIPSSITFIISTLPKILQTIIKPSTLTIKSKPLQKKKTIIQELKDEELQKQDVLAKQVFEIEPFDFFVLLPFYNLNQEQTNILKNILQLDENMMPNKYTIFESFNTIIEKKETGLIDLNYRFIYNVKQSDISKKFLEIEPSLRETLFDFTKLNKKAIQIARKEMLELLQVVQILYDFELKNYSSLATTIINNIIRIYSNLIKNSKNDENIIKYLTTSIELLEYRRNKMNEEIPELIKQDKNRRFITKETAGILDFQPNTQPTQQIQQGDEEIGEEHYDDRFDDDGFDDIDIVEENDSMLLG